MNISKVKLGVIIAITFFIGVSVGVSGNDSSVTSGDIKQSTSSSDSSSSNSPIKETGKVEVKSHSKSIDYGYPKIVGEVINNTSKPVTYVKIIATYYNSAGKVVGTDFIYAGDTANTPLTVGATAPFEITDINKTSFDNYKLDVSWD